MKSDDTTIPNILEIKTISPSSSPKEEASGSPDSSDSSPSDLRRRLEDLPSPNEFTFLADRVAALGQRICRKREVFLRLHEVANRIEESDEGEEREHRAGSSRQRDARARRRARVRLDDEAMVISQAGGSTSASGITGKLNPGDESSVDRSARLSTIAIPSRGQSWHSSLSEPSSTRFSSGGNGKSRNTKCEAVPQSCRNLKPRDTASKSTDLPSVSPFSLSSVRPRKFGGYRPPSGVVLKNLSSGSESESINETSRGFSSARKIGSAIGTLELSSPESTTISYVNEPIKKMPIMSARNDITGSILPNLLPSSRSLDSDDLGRRISQNTSRGCIEQIKFLHDGKTCNQLGKVNTSVKAFNERASHDGFVAKTSSESPQVGPEYEGMRHQRQEAPRETSMFFTKSVTSESAELGTYNEQVTHNESTIKANEFEGTQDDREDKVEDYRHFASKTHDDSPADLSTFEDNSSENNGHVFDVAEWNRSTSLYTEPAVDTSHFIERIQNDVTEEPLSSRASEPYGSKDHSRSSCTAKIYLQKESLASSGPQNGIDTPEKYDREFITKVPTLTLNSQDISYSTSAGSREWRSTRPIDPHALIKALSDVSLKQEKQGDVSRKRESFYRSRDAIDPSNGASDFPAKGETWRVPRFSTSDSPGKSLSRVPSRIPVRVSSNKSVLKPENSNETGIYARLKFTEQNGGPRERVVHQINSYSQICKQNSSLRSRSGNIEVAIAKGVFVPDDEAAEYEINDRALKGSLTSSNLRSCQSTSFGDYIYDKMQYLPGSKGEGCPAMFLRKAAYSNGRDYAKIDDDVCSRSDRSTSRKSVNTSATESPKYRKNESLRNMEENVTWRTEDECASINDEENVEDVRDKDYGSCDEKSEEPSLQENERYRLAMPFRTQHLQLDSPSDMQKDGRKRNHADDDFNDDKLSLEQNLETTKIAQSEDLTFQIHRTQERSNFAARISSSTLNLYCEPKRKKKRSSQERFPFTISEATEALSIKHEDASDYLDENVARKDDRPREKTVHQLKTHPSVTRLATSGTEDTVAEILCCVAQEKRENATSSKSKIKALVRIFSSRLKKAPKRPSDDKTLEQAKIIYENDACQEDSRASTCSGDSSKEETSKTCSRNRCVERYAARSNSTGSLQAIAQEHPHRRYDRDDLWVQDIKDFSIEEKKDGEISRGEDEADGTKGSPKDRYSIFFAKNLEPDEPSTFNRDNSPKEQHDVIIPDHTGTSEGYKRSSDRKISSNIIPPIEEIEEDLTGCLCWRLCRIIVPFKRRSPINARDDPSSGTNQSDSLLRKRKKRLSDENTRWYRQLIASIGGQESKFENTRENIRR